MRCQALLSRLTMELTRTCQKVLQLLSVYHQCPGVTPTRLRPMLPESHPGTGDKVSVVTSPESLLGVYSPTRHSQGGALRP